ncbi:hypothetical protein lbkm_3666 [Lachnospiraceae bacterium KM106-2]|nr:hypothetical protein lbkm_3666 [Lachnospiraceae bacterium KM106-2]
MKKKSIGRGITGFAFGIAGGQIIQLLIVLFSGQEHLVPLVPAYRSYFQSDVLALGVYNLLVGVISGVFGASSVIFDLEKWSFLKQGIIHFLITTAVWFPIAVFVWGLFIYPQAVINTFISFSITYLITWIVQYQLCRKSIDDINKVIQKRRE